MITETLKCSTCLLLVLVCSHKLADCLLERNFYNSRNFTQSVFDSFGTLYAKWEYLNSGIESKIMQSWLETKSWHSWSLKFVLRRIGIVILMNDYFCANVLLKLKGVQLQLQGCWRIFFWCLNNQRKNFRFFNLCWMKLT